MEKLEGSKLPSKSVMPSFLEFLVEKSQPFEVTTQTSQLVSGHSKDTFKSLHDLSSIDCELQPDTTPLSLSGCETKECWTSTTCKEKMFKQLSASENFENSASNDEHICLSSGSLRKLQSAASLASKSYLFCGKTVKDLTLVASKKVCLKRKLDMTYLPVLAKKPAEHQFQSFGSKPATKYPYVNCSSGQLTLQSSSESRNLFLWNPRKWKQSPIQFSTKTKNQPGFCSGTRNFQRITDSDFEANNIMVRVIEKSRVSNATLFGQFGKKQDFSRALMSRSFNPIDSFRFKQMLSDDSTVMTVSLLDQNNSQNFMQHLLQSSIQAFCRHISRSVENLFEDILFGDHNKDHKLCFSVKLIDQKGNAKMPNFSHADTSKLKIFEDATSGTISVVDDLSLLKEENSVSTEFVKKTEVASANVVDYDDEKSMIIQNSIKLHSDSVTDFNHQSLIRDHYETPFPIRSSKKKALSTLLNDKPSYFLNFAIQKTIKTQLLSGSRFSVGLRKTLRRNKVPRALAQPNVYVIKDLTSTTSLTADKVRFLLSGMMLCSAKHLRYTYPKRPFNKTISVGSSQPVRLCTTDHSLRGDDPSVTVLKEVSNQRSGPQTPIYSHENDEQKRDSEPGRSFTRCKASALSSGVNAETAREKENDEKSLAWSDDLPEIESNSRELESGMINLLKNESETATKPNVSFDEKNAGILSTVLDPMTVSDNATIKNEIPSLHDALKEVDGLTGDFIACDHATVSSNLRKGCNAVSAAAVTVSDEEAMQELEELLALSQVHKEDFKERQVIYAKQNFSASNYSLDLLQHSPEGDFKDQNNEKTSEKADAVNSGLDLNSSKIGAKALQGSLGKSILNGDEYQQLFGSEEEEVENSFECNSSFDLCSDKKEDEKCGVPSKVDNEFKNYLPSSKSEDRFDCTAQLMSTQLIKGRRDDDPGSLFSEFCDFSEFSCIRTNSELDTKDDFIDFHRVPAQTGPEKSRTCLSDDVPQDSTLVADRLDFAEASRTAEQQIVPLCAALGACADGEQTKSCLNGDGTKAISSVTCMRTDEFDITESKQKSCCESDARDYEAGESLFNTDDMVPDISDLPQTTARDPLSKIPTFFVDEVESSKLKVAVERFLNFPKRTQAANEAETEQMVDDDEDVPIATISTSEDNLVPVVQTSYHGHIPSCDDTSSNDESSATEEEQTKDETQQFDLSLLPRKYDSKWKKANKNSYRLSPVRPLKTCDGRRRVGLSRRTSSTLKPRSYFHE